MEKLAGEFNTKRLLYLQELATHSIYSLKEITAKQLLVSNHKTLFSAVIYMPCYENGGITDNEADIVIRPFGHAQMSDHVEETWQKSYSIKPIIIGAGNIRSFASGDIAVTLFSLRASSMGTRLSDAQKEYPEFSQPGNLDTIVKGIIGRELQAANPEASVTTTWM